MPPIERSMWNPETGLFHAGVLLIDLVASVVIAGYVILAMFKLARGGGIDQARLLVAEGAVLGLSFKVAATLLKTLELHTWEQILMFAAILALRTILKQVFLWEQREVRRSSIMAKR
jgi:uncharacterized membrane protein